MFIEDPTEYFNLMERLFEERFSLRQIGIERQEMQYWRANGIINITPSNADERVWTKVSFFDLCWLRMVDEMRKMGVSIEVIKQLKEYFYSVDEEVVNTIVEKMLQAPSYNLLVKTLGEEVVKQIITDLPHFSNMLKEHFTHLLLVTLILINTNYPVYLIIVPGEKPDLLLLNESTKDEIDFSEYFLKGRSFYTIYLNPITDGFFENQKVKEEDLQQMFKLSRKEKEIIKFLRKENVKELKIKFDPAKKKGIVMVELIEIKDLLTTQKNLQSLLEKGKFKQIKIQTEGTRLLFIEETTKIKLENL
jgi:DNA-binding transcriptional MerR regulator